MRAGRFALTVALLTFGAGVGLLACREGSGTLAAGQECHGASECGPGLVCDFGQTPAVCAGALTTPTPMIDGAPGMPDAPPTPDAPPGTPDAAPDAPLPPPDAAVPDAALPDADLPDAMT
jgi:hypothetical protein